jgi:hypothetical protein
MFTNEEQGNKLEKIILHQYKEISCYFRLSICPYCRLPFYPFFLPCSPLILPSIHSSRRLSIYVFISRFPISFSYPSVHQTTHPPHRQPVYLFILRSFLSFIRHSYLLLISTLIWRFIHPPVHSHIHTRPPIFPSLHHSHRTPSSTIRPSVRLAIHALQ